MGPSLSPSASEARGRENADGDRFPFQPGEKERMPLYLYSAWRQGLKCCSLSVHTYVGMCTNKHSEAFEAVICVPWALCYHHIHILSIYGYHLFYVTSGIIKMMQRDCILLPSGVRGQLRSLWRVQLVWIFLFIYFF